MGGLGGGGHMTDLSFMSNKLFMFFEGSLTFTAWKITMMIVIFLLVSHTICQSSVM